MSEAPYPGDCDSAHEKPKPEDGQSEDSPGQGSPYSTWARFWPVRLSRPYI